MRIAYQGEPGAFSEAASRQIAADGQMMPCKSFEDVFAAVNTNGVDFGVLPIENSIGGSIHPSCSAQCESLGDWRPRGKTSAGHGWVLSRVMSSLNRNEVGN